MNTTEATTTVTPNTKRKQKQLGPAPIASIDSIDIPDEVRHRVCITVFRTLYLTKYHKALRTHLHTHIDTRL